MRFSNIFGVIVALSAAALIAGTVSPSRAGDLPQAASPDAPRLILVQSSRDYLPPSDSKDDGPRRITPPSSRSGEAPPPPADSGGATYGKPYGPPSEEAYATGPHPREHYGPPDVDERTYSSNEILDAGRRFFGTVSRGLASVVEYAFRKQGRPNGYILGEGAGGAFVAGVRYGEGTLYTKGFRPYKIYWQGPSIGYDFGAEGSKTLTLVYNLADPEQMFHRFAGVDGSAYFVGGAGITFQQHDDVILAPIRSGVGLRFGANVGYLKYTPYPTWNPF
jgi:hypothetical protein